MSDVCTTHQFDTSRDWNYTLKALALSTAVATCLRLRLQNSVALRRVMSAYEYVYKYF